LLKKLKYIDKNKLSFYSITSFAIATLCLLWVLIYNHFPLFTADSSAYIEHAFNNKIPCDRPVFYSWFIKSISVSNSLWWTVVCQALILALLLGQFIYCFFPQLSPIHKLFIIAATSLLTQAPWYVAQIMPDLFTPILGLSVLLFLNTPDKKKMVLYGFFILLSIISHNSNLISGLVFIVILFIINLFTNQYRLSLKRFMMAMALCLSSWLIVCFTNYKAGNGFTPNHLSHIYLMGKLSENGILKTYLDDKCSTHSYKICPYRSELPNHAWDFIWLPNGPFAQSGGWYQDPTEYQQIIKGTLTEGRYLKMHFKESIKATYQQFLLTYVGDGIVGFNTESGVYNTIKNNYPNSIPEFNNTRQNKGTLAFDFFNNLYKISFYILLIASLLILYISKNRTYFILFLWTFAFTLINAFTTATFANVLARLNSRSIWLLSFVCILIIAHFLVQKTNKKTETLA
jgi:hypothetical protein